MAETNPPGWLQNAGATHTAVQQRNYISGLLAGANASASLVSRGGVNGALGNKLLVTQTGSPSMAVIIKSGVAWVPGTENASQGAYGVMNDADVTLSVTAAHATLARIDLVCYKVQDSQYSGATNSSSLVVIAGTPSGSPAVPAAPANSLILAQIAVGAAVSSITNANITDRRTWLPVGTIPCTSTTRPAAGTVPVGQMIFEINTLDVLITLDGGTTWLFVFVNAWTAYTPIWTTNASSPAVGNGSLSGKYKWTGNTVNVHVNLSVGSTTTFGSGFWLFTLPTVPGPAIVTMGKRSGSAMFYDISSDGPHAGSTHLITDTQICPGCVGFVTATNPFPFASGDGCDMDITYDV